MTEKVDRSKFIGGSDAAGVLGLSRWATPLSVWAEKTGQYARPEEDTEATALGKELEDYVAKRFERKTGKRVYRSPEPLLHPEYAFIGANVDRLIENEPAGLECKTCSAWKAKEWEGEEIPREYAIQCHHYMFVTGFKKWYLAVLIGNHDYLIKEIYWDDKIMREILNREVTFWKEFVEPGIMPTIITAKDTETLAALFPQAEEGKIIQLTDEANILIENLVSYKQDLKNLEGNIEAIENQLKALIKENETGVTSLYSIKWGNSQWSGLDGKGLKLAYPDIHKQFYKTKQIRKFKYEKAGENGES